ncbi:MAG: recombinase family protein [Endomicrobia bacterium]|nr:recombinase family protein [Endomicrobiia bacterium]
MLVSVLRKDSDISTIIVWQLSRLARNRYDYGYMMNEFEKRGIRVMYV